MVKSKRRHVRHIGYLALCDGKRRDDNFLRIDLGASRYRQLGVVERFKDEKPYRVCKRCIRKLPYGKTPCSPRPRRR
jgi:hypothetical protein